VNGARQFTRRWPPPCFAFLARSLPPTTTTITPGLTQFSTWAARCHGARCTWYTRRHGGGGDKALELREVLGEEVERPVTRSKMRWRERMAAWTKLQSLSLLVFIVWLGCETALFLQHQQKWTQNKITRLEHHWRTYMSVVVEVTAKKKCSSWGPLPTHWT
jgi:hypothetical protein